MSHALKMTTIVSLLQPPPEVFSLFDDLMFLCEGRMLYHGPLEGAVPHFTASGFICPVRKDVASFLLEITTPTGQQHQHHQLVLLLWFITLITHECLERLPFGQAGALGQFCSTIKSV